MTSSGDAATAPFQTTVCPHCGARVPGASYCGACGAHLTHARRRGAARRAHAYSAFPDESVFRLAVVSSLFPQLAGRSRDVYRIAFAFIVVVLAAVAVAGLDAPVIAISALAVPLLLLIYVWEIDPLEVRFAVPTAAIFVAGAGLGVGWGLLLGPLVSDSLVPRLAASLTTGGVLVSALVVPAVGQLLMVLPVAVARLWRPARSEALDGFTAGAAGALGLTLAATLTQLAPLLRDGNLEVGSSVLANLTQAVVRGLSDPLIAAAATGYIGAALWSRRGTGPAAGGRWLTSPLVALAIALVLQIGLGYADAAGLPDIALLVVHLVAAAVALLVLRIGLHHVLLHEDRDVRIGPPRVCPHCYRVVPAMPFCPMCGVAERATGLNPLPLTRTRRGDGPPGGAGPAGQATGAERLESPGSTAGHPATATAARPVAGDLPQDTAVFRDARPGELTGVRRLGHSRVLAVLIGGLAVLTVVLVVLAFVLPPAPPKPCTSLSCFAPFGTPVQPPHVYTSPAGWSVQWYPASAVFSQQPPTTSAVTSSGQLELNFTNPSAPAEDGQLAFVGGPAQGQSAQAIVTSLQQANAPNAVPDYQLPGASVGYLPGYGEGFQTQAVSGNGDPITYEVVISCAVRYNYAICAYATGPQVNLNSVLNHPTESKLALTLWANPDVNGVRWKGESLP